MNKQNQSDRSELDVVAAVLAADGHVREAYDDVAVGVGDDVDFEHTEDGHPPRDPGAGVQRQRPGLDVLEQLRDVGREAGGEDRHLQVDDRVPLAADAAGVNLGVPDVGAAVPEASGAGGEREGGRVGVVHGRVEKQGEVGLGEARGDADDSAGEEARGGVADAEHGEEEDEEGDAQEEEHAEGDQEADATAPAAAAAAASLELEVVGGGF